MSARPAAPVSERAAARAALLGAGFGIVTDIWLALAYVGTVLLLLAYRPVWRSRLSFMGWAGRMALTNYIVQAALIDALSSPYGMGLRLRPYGIVLATAMLFGVQVFLSRLRLSSFRIGPVEWLLRSLSYGRPQPIVPRWWGAARGRDKRTGRRVSAGRCLCLLPVACLSYTASGCS